MSKTDLNHLSATEIARRIAGGETTAVAVTEACLARIEEREEALQAWAFIDPELALEQAPRYRDAHRLLLQLQKPDDSAR